MIQCIQYRKSSFLGSSDWLTIPWSKTSKDINQQLYDRGFALAALLEQMDNANVTNQEVNISTMVEFLGRLSSLDDELTIWYRDIVQDSPSPLYWHTQSRLPNKNPKEARAPSPPQPFTFPTLLLAHTVITHWALRLILSNAIALTSTHILSKTQNPSPHPTFRRENQNLQAPCLHLLATHTPSHRLELATNIIRSMPYCLNDTMGLLGAQKSLFAMRTALFVLQRHPGSEESKWCRVMYEELGSKKGLGYAREIAKVEGRYSVAGTGTSTSTGIEK